MEILETILNFSACVVFVFLGGWGGVTGDGSWATFCLFFWSKHFFWIRERTFFSPTHTKRIPQEAHKCFDKKKEVHKCWSPQSAQTRTS